MFGEVGGLVQLFDHHFRIRALGFGVMEGGEGGIDFGFCFAQVGEGDFFGLVVAFHLPSVAVQQQVEHVGVALRDAGFGVGVAELHHGSSCIAGGVLEDVFVEEEAEA